MLTIISPAAHQRLATVDALKLELGLTGGADDAFLQSLLDQASAAIAGWCGRVFAVEGVKEATYPQYPRGHITLSRWPVVSVETVTVGNLSVDPALVEADASGELYRVDADGYRRRWESARVVIEYTAGFVLPGDGTSTLPADIERAALVQAKGWYLGRDRDPALRSEAASEIGSVDYFASRPAALSPEVEGLMSKYRSVLVG